MRQRELVIASLLAEANRGDVYPNRGRRSISALSRRSPGGERRLAWVDRL